MAITSILNGGYKPTNKTGNGTTPLSFLEEMPQKCMGKPGEMGGQLREDI